MHLFFGISTLSCVTARSHRALSPGDQYWSDLALACLLLNLVSIRQRLKHSQSIFCLLLNPPRQDSSESGQGLWGVHTKMAVFCQATAFGLLLIAVGLLPSGRVATGQSHGGTKVHLARNTAKNAIGKTCFVQVWPIYDLLHVAAIQRHRK